MGVLKKILMKILKKMEKERNGRHGDTIYIQIFGGVPRCDSMKSLDKTTETRQ